jgi:hypothetical protein
MTDYNKLIARVRSPFALTERDAQEIADALEAQAKEIAEKDARISELENGWLDEAKKMCARIAELDGALREAIKEVSRWSRECGKYEARIAELEAALTPLAEMDYWIEPHHDAHDSIEQCNQLTVAEILAARAALKGEKE